VVAGVDIGGTKTALMVTDVKNGEDVATDAFETPAELGPDRLIEHLLEAVSRAVWAAGRRRDDVRAIGIAVPGPVSPDGGRVIVAGNFCGWVDVPLHAEVVREWQLPVWVEQDANEAALGEKWRGGAKELNSIVFLAVGTGVGAGGVVNGRLRRAYHAAAGEIGNSVFGRELLGHERGGHGSLELLVGSPAIRERAQAATAEEMSAVEALTRATSDERLARLAAEVADYLAMAVIAIAALLDPAAIVFGGGTAEAGEALLKPVRRRVERELSVRPVLICSALGEEAQLHGAVFGALWQLDPDLALREELR
jgi:glucokinase